MSDHKKPIKLPQIIGHRGAAGYAPENTLESIHTAADMGVEWVELDVKLTKDDIPVVFHDDTLDRTTNGSGPLANVTYNELQTLECGAWFADSFAGIKIPTLEEAIDTILERDLGLNLEIKPCPKRDKETAEASLDILSQYWEDTSSVLISSFSYTCLEIAQDMAPTWHRGLLLGTEWPENWQDLSQYLNVSTINIRGDSCSQAQIEHIVSLNKLALCYTVNDPLQARKLQSWGVRSFFTDTPDVLQDGLLTVH